MDLENEKKKASKKSSKPMQVGGESQDEEPIGSLFKLKSKRNPKKVKTGPDGVSEKDQDVEGREEKFVGVDEGLGGMNDTLASFKKKLKGPKKGGGSGITGRRNSGTALAELAGQSLNEAVKEGGLTMETEVVENVHLIGDGGSDGGKELDYRVKQRTKRFKSASRAKKTVQQSSDGSNRCMDDNSEESLSAFFQKALLGSSRKHPSYLRPKKREETQVTKNGFGSNDILEDLPEDLLRRSQSSSNLPNEYPQQSNRSCLASVRIPVGSVHSQNCTGINQTMQNNALPVSAMLELSSTPETVDVNRRSSDNMHKEYPYAILDDSVPVSSSQKSQSYLSACSEVDRRTGRDRDESQLVVLSAKLEDSHSPQSKETTSAIENIMGGLRQINVGHDFVEMQNSASLPSQMEEIRQFGAGVSNIGFNGALNLQPTNLPTIHSSRKDQKEGQEDFLGVDSLNRLCDETSKDAIKQITNKSLELSAHSSPHNGTVKTKDELCFQPSLKRDSQSPSSCSALGTQMKKEMSSDCYHISPELCLNECAIAVQMPCSDALHSQTFNEMSIETGVPNLDYPSVSLEANGASSPSSMVPDRSGSYAEGKGHLPDPEVEDKKQSAVQRSVRKARKRRHWDMAYEGDADWEVLIHEQCFLDSRLVGDDDQSLRAREKSNFSPHTVTEGENVGAAAVSAGLKARALGPVEKIRFKEVLKRKGGLQEFLQCRDLILGLWNRDVSRVLPLMECGVTTSPSPDESPGASLLREIYAFLDKCGYINVGVASEKDRAEPGALHNFNLLKEENVGEKAMTPDADTYDGVSFILGRARSSEVCMEEKNCDILDDQKWAAEVAKDGNLVTLHAMNKPTVVDSNEIGADELYRRKDSIDAKCPNRKINLDILSSNPSGGVLDSDSMEGNDSMQCYSEGRKRVIVIGAGPAGLIAARHLQRQGFSVAVLEARNRVGGRVYTDRSSLSVPVDLGASIITGVEADVDTERRADPSSLVCAQLGLELTVLNSDCPLYDIVSGQIVPTYLDEALEAEYNSLLDDTLLLVAQKGERAMKMSLEEGLEYALKRRRMARLGRNYGESELHNFADFLVDSEKSSVGGDISENNHSKEGILSPLERRVMDWHFANLEYGCAAVLKEVSLPYWNQDDVYGGFGGAHCMIKGGYSTVVESLGEGLCIHLNHVVTDISYYTDSSRNDDRFNRVKISTSNGREFVGDAVLITVPLGCLKEEVIKFSPPLPHWKKISIQRLGFGVLNKVVLEFPEVFWDESVDYFGATAEETNQRGKCFMFWNVKKTVAAPVLIALVVGKAAIDGHPNITPCDHVNHALTVLRKLFGEAVVPDPVASVVTDWGNDPFSYGAYSYVAVGASGHDYDILGRPVENCLFFAGEATCKEHPDTVGGAMMSGLREAVRIMDILNTGNDYTAEIEAMEAAQRHSDSERNEVRDIVKRLEAVDLSSVLYKNSLDGAELLTREALLEDMFCHAKTTPGRLHLAKELLNLSVQALKSFAGTKEGLRTLNSWILDAMGKDGTQLLRHCVRLLVLVSTDLLAVRLSGIGKTIKEKVCVHTSRDIRAIASQLVNVWIEVFRKEKASNGRLKLLRQSTGSETLRGKSLASAKPPRMHHGHPHSRGSAKISASAGGHLTPNGNVMRVNVKPVKFETGADLKLEGKSSRYQDREDAMCMDDHEVVMSNEEQAAVAAAEAARAAALAAAEAYASSEAKCNTSLPLPKILSFHKFARREQYPQMDEPDMRTKWSAGALGRQDCTSEIDSRNCRVREWSVDFSAACANLDNSKMSVDNLSQRSHSNEIAGQLNFREQSAESASVDSCLLTKAWVDASGSVGVKDYNAIDRWQSQAAAAESDFFHRSMQIRDEEDSNVNSNVPSWKCEQLANESSVSQVTVNKELFGNQPRGTEHIKQAVVDYVASLLMPLYKAKKIDKEGYKSIMKKTATKVMEQTTDAEKAMAVFEFLDFKRKNKIRSFVDKLIERHMAIKPLGKP